MKVRMMTIAGICMIGLAACGSAVSTSAPIATATSHPAVASQPPATTPAAPVTAPTSVAPGTTPTAAATAPASLVPPTPGTATVAALWCGPVFGVFTAPNLSSWESGAYGYDAYTTVIPNIKTTTAAIENLDTLSSGIPLADGLCGEVQSADEDLPPVSQATYAAAMSDFLKASEVLRTLPGGTISTVVNSTRPYLNSGMAELNTFLSAIGK